MNFVTLVIFWAGEMQPRFQVLSPTRRSVGTGRREPWERGWGNETAKKIKLLFHYYVILPYKVKRTSKIRGRNTL